MGGKMAKTSGQSESTSGQSDYGCSVMELRNLMEYRGAEAKEKVCDGEMCSSTSISF